MKEGDLVDVINAKGKKMFKCAYPVYKNTDLSFVANCLYIKHNSSYHFYDQNGHFVYSLIKAKQYQNSKIVPIKKGIQDLPLVDGMTIECVTSSSPISSLWDTEYVILFKGKELYRSIDENKIAIFVLGHFILSCEGYTYGEKTNFIKEWKDFIN